MRWSGIFGRLAGWLLGWLLVTGVWGTRPNEVKQCPVVSQGNLGCDHQDRARGRGWSGNIGRAHVESGRQAAIEGTSFHSLKMRTEAASHAKQACPSLVPCSVVCFNPCSLVAAPFRAQVRIQRPFAALSLVPYSCSSRSPSAPTAPNRTQAKKGGCAALLPGGLA